MQRLSYLVITAFVWIFVATALLTLAGLAYTWFGAPQVGMPYLGTLVTALIIEVIGVVLLIGKQSLKYLPSVVHNKTNADTSKFMADFVSNGTHVVIVSNRVGWLINDLAAKQAIMERASAGAHIEVVTSQQVDDSVRIPLQQAGVRFFQTESSSPPEARFTLVNANRSGAERLAIATGTHPDHQITIFDANTGPQIIGMAKDIVRKSKDALRA